MEHEFATKTGTCIITPAQIVLERQGIAGGVAIRIYGRSITRTLLMYGVIGVIAVAMGAWSLATGSQFFGIAICLIGVYFLWNIFVSRSNSAVPIIDRSTIVSVEAHPPRPLLTRGYFVVRFVDNGKMCRRLIMLPGSRGGGKEEYRRALLIMEQSGLMPANS
jgi:hypothetical protein